MIELAAVSQDLITQYLLLGDLLGFFLAIYVRPMGQLFYGFLAGMPLTALYLKTHSLAAVSIICLLLGVFLKTIFPVMLLDIAAILILFGGAGVLWIVFFGKPKY